MALNEFFSILFERISKLHSNMHALVLAGWNLPRYCWNGNEAGRWHHPHQHSDQLLNPKFQYSVNEGARDSEQKVASSSVMIDLLSDASPPRTGVLFVPSCTTSSLLAAMKLVTTYTRRRFTAQCDKDAGRKCTFLTWSSRVSTLTGYLVFRLHYGTQPDGYAKWCHSTPVTAPYKRAQST